VTLSHFLLVIVTEGGQLPHCV